MGLQIPDDENEGWDWPEWLTPVDFLLVLFACVVVAVVILVGLGLRDREDRRDREAREMIEERCL
jgi:hypothetical protein